MARERKPIFEKVPGSGVWYIRYYDDAGRRHCERAGSEASAAEGYKKRARQIEDSVFCPPRSVNKLKFGELMDLAFADRKVRLAPTSYESDLGRAKRLREWFGEMPAAKVTAALIQERIRELCEGGLEGSTCNRYKALVSAMFTFAIKAKKLSHSPMRAVESFREGDGRVRFLDREEEAALRKVIERDCPKCEPELDLALNTGLRRNELFRLRWDQVDLERAILTVQGKRPAKGGGKGQRFVRLNSVAVEALRRLHRQSRGSAWVCPGKHDPPSARDWREWFEDAVKSAGLEDFHYHDLRHTFASRLVMAGVPLAAVQELMGHRFIVTTQRYSHLAPDHQRANVEKLATEYGNSGRLLSIAVGQEK